MAREALELQLQRLPVGGGNCEYRFAVKIKNDVVSVREGIDEIIKNLPEVFNSYEVFLEGRILGVKCKF